MEKLYIGTYCNGGEDSLFAAIFDEESGSLTITGASGQVDNPSYLAVGRNGLLYAVSETDEFAGHLHSGGVAMLQAGENSFELLDAKATLGGAPCHILLEEERSMLFVSNYFGGSISAFEIHLDAHRLHLAQQIQHRGSGPNPLRQESAHVHFCGFVGGRLCGADLGLDTLKCYRLDQCGLVPDTPGDIYMPKGSGVRHFITSKLYPNTLLAVCELSSEVMIIDTKPQGGVILQRLSTLPSACESTCAAIKQSKDGRYVFASNRGHDSIAVIALEPEGRKMRLVDIVKCEGKTPRDLLVLEKHILVCNQDSNDITIFTFDPTNGGVKFTGEKVECPKPACITTAKG
ncbi:MAG: lactonase family protein [Candidatus Limiplasma sp.]|nr:lactonase family protein [Candidatus Limiplasma sp.]